MKNVVIHGEFKIGEKEFVILDKTSLEELLSDHSLALEDQELLEELTEEDLDNSDIVSEEEAMSALFSNRIAHYRKSSGLSQQDLADKTGFHQSAIARWESGKVTPGMKNIRILSEALSCSIEDLLTDPK